MKNILPVLVIGTVLTACGSSGPSANSLAKTCEQETDMSAAMCSCVADRAAEELDANGRALIEAMLLEDRDKVNEVRRDMTMEEMTTASTFLIRAPGACAMQVDEN